MAGISFLYAVWHSPAVRSLLSLDDVDFTVLAATSVLGDLIEKCPPAEACRDAFDRMSKATIQMCMSTTGFGPDALRGMPSNYQTTPTPKSYSPNTTYTSTSGGEADARSDTEMTGFPANNNYFSQPTRRQQPRFDMNLRDLFSEDETDKRSFSRISNQLSSMRPPPAPQQIKQEPQQMQQISPRMGNHPQNFNFDPNLRPPQTIPASQHQQFPTSGGQMTPPLSNTAPMASPYQISNQLPYNAFSSQITQTYPDLGFSDLDFLDSFPVQGAGHGAGLERSDAAGGLQDLGFGMGFGDGTHDWSDGNGFDLFDGFFFGPGGSGGV